MNLCGYCCTSVDTVISYTLYKLHHRILDNLPLVVPVTRQDKNSIAYQGGYHVGLKGMYSGVSPYALLMFTFSLCMQSLILCWNPLSICLDI